MASRRYIPACILLVAGCAVGGPERDDAVNGVDARQPSAADAGEEPYALRVNRTLIYPVQWGRAEDLAETLRPLLISRFGPGTTVVPHPESNHLLIYVPPASAREGSRGGAAAQTRRP